MNSNNELIILDPFEKIKLDIVNIQYIQLLYNIKIQQYSQKEQLKHNNFLKLNYFYGSSMYSYNRSLYLLVNYYYYYFIYFY